MAQLVNILTLVSNIYEPCHFKTWAIITLHIYLSFVALSKAFCYPSYSCSARCLFKLISHSFLLTFNILLVSNFLNPLSSLCNREILIVSFRCYIYKSFLISFSLEFLLLLTCSAHSIFSIILLL